jgi:membrane protein implicated in regulation of membrane protease activity
MSNGEIDENGSSGGPQFRAGPLITSAALVGAGTLIALAGLAVGSTHLLTAIRQWVREMETPPSELARQRWTQAKAAVAAGQAAWQNGPSPTPPVES